MMMEREDLDVLVNLQILIILLPDGDLGLVPRTSKIKDVTVTNVIILLTNVCPPDLLEAVYLSNNV